MNDLKVGMVVTFEEEPYEILYTQHVQMGRGSAVLRSKMKNLASGKVLEKTFKGGDQIEEADLEHKKAQFLYREEGLHHFMDNENYDQFAFTTEQLGDTGQFIKESDEVDVMYYEGKPISVRLPAKVALKVVSAAPAVKGDTAQGGATKPVTLETGMVLNAPLFIKEGDMIKVNTETGEYVERVKQ